MKRDELSLGRLLLGFAFNVDYSSRALINRLMGKRRFKFSL